MRPLDPPPQVKGTLGNHEQPSERLDCHSAIKTFLGMAPAATEPSLHCPFAH